MPLRQLFPDPKDASGELAKVDVIAVHGLNPRSDHDADHAWDTWRTPPGPNGRLWLRDDLPRHIPDLRIFLYEYNATAVYGEDRDSFVGKASELLEAIRIKRDGIESRPILLFGHSMGGLLIKQALINAHNNPKYTPIKDATKGLAFFATPHRGGEPSLVALGRLAAKIAIAAGFQRGDNVVEVLDPGTIFSDLLQEHWRHQLLGYDIVSFWGARDKIVPVHSARLGLPGDRENVVKLNADHREVCKFGDSQTDQDNFELVWSNIRDIYKEALKDRESSASLGVGGQERGTATDEEPVYQIEGQKHARRPTTPQQRRLIQPAGKAVGRINNEWPRPRSPWQRSTSPVPPSTPSGQTPRVSSTYRISNIEITVCEEDLRAALQRLRLGAGFRMRSCAPATLDRQTAVVTFSRNVRLQAVCDKVAKCRTIGQLRPDIDDRFLGITPLASPWYDKKALIKASEGQLKWPSRIKHWLPWSTSVSSSLPFQSVLFDVILLTPPGQHAFDFWTTDPDDFNTEAMWAVDFLPNEGFDKTRISILGSGQGDTVGKACFDRISEYIRKSQLGSKHTVILVEFLSRKFRAKSLVPEICRRYENKPLGPRLQVLIFKEPGEDRHQQSFDTGAEPQESSVTELIWPAGTPRDQEPLRFSSNGHPLYRALVKEIWRSLHENYQPRNDRRRSRPTIGNPLQHLQELARPLANWVSVTQAEQGDGRGPLDNHPDFYAIVEDEDFRKWLDPGSEPQVLWIAAPPNSKLRELCQLLPSRAAGYDVLHINCGDIGHEFKQQEDYGKGSNLIGPFLLRVFMFVLCSWADKFAGGGTMVEAAATDLLQGILRGSGADYNAEDAMAASDGDAFVQSLVGEIEGLGSNLVDVLSDALKLGSTAKPSAVKSSKLMVLLSGLHGFKKSPELGRLIHCVRELHSVLAELSVCKILFTYDERQHLKGLLGDFTGISHDDEVKDCLLSLKRTITRTKQIDRNHENTLEWFREDKGFKGWKASGRSGLLLLFGKPASGKSVLCQFLCEPTKGRLYAAENRWDAANTGAGQAGREENVVASFFFNADGPQELGMSRVMLQDLLYSMLDQNRSFFPHFQRQFRRLRQWSLSQPGQAITWRDDDLMAVLRKVRCHPLPGRVYVLVDGLDEASNPLQCAKALSELVQECEGGAGGGLCIKLLVAMQPDGPAEQALKQPLATQGVPIPEITLQERNTSDILEYSRAFLGEAVIGPLGWKPEQVEKALKIIVNKSQGIFLWAKLAKDLICDFLSAQKEASIAELERFLSEIPPRMEEIYERLFNRLEQRIPSEKDRDSHIYKVNRMFQIVMEAKRLLSLEEFRDVYSCPDGRDPGSVKLDEVRPTNIANVVANHTANFLEVNKEMDTVNFLHSTASAFLRGRLKRAQSLEATTSSQELTVVGSACIWYLQKVSVELERIPCSPESMPVGGMEAFVDEIGKYPLLSYALEHTPDHLSRSRKLRVDAMRRLSKSMEKSPMRFFLSAWMERQAKRMSIPALAPKTTIPENCGTFRNGVLHCAAARCQATAVKIALAAGADANSKTELYESREDALCLAILSSRDQPSAEVEKVVRALLDHKADPNAETHFGGTPLHYACKYMQEGVVKLLLSHHARFDKRDAQNMTPLHRTVIGLDRRMPTLEDAENDDDGAGTAPERIQTRPNGSLPRHVRLRCVKLLIEAGAQPDAGDGQGMRPIHWAAALRDDDDIVKALLDAVALKGYKRRRAANVKCDKLTTPLHWASGYNNQRVVNLLLQEGAGAAVSDKRGKTAINWAARYGHHEVLTALLDSIRKENAQAESVRQGKGQKGSAGKEGKELKAAVNMQETRTGRHALIWACKKGHGVCAQLLIDAGADVNLAEGRDGDVGGTPLSWAITHGHLDIVELLLDNGAKRDEGKSKRPVLGWAAASGNVRVFERLLHTWLDNHVKLNPDEPDMRGSTPFMLAAARDHVEMLEHLHKTHGIQVDAKDREGNTALLRAAGWGRLNAVRWLVTVARLEINHTNFYGDTALHRAANWGHQDMVKYLLSAGAKANMENSRGKTYRQLEEDYRGRNELMALGNACYGRMPHQQEEEGDSDSEEEDF